MDDQGAVDDAVNAVMLVSFLFIQLRRLDMYPHTGVALLASNPVHLEDDIYLPLQLCATCVIDLALEEPCPITVAKMASFAIQATRALAHCHNHGIFHLDVKPDNMLVTSDGTLKLCDFGAASMDPRTTGCFGTSAYASPEMVASKYTAMPYCAAKADVWSLAVSMYVLASGNFLWDLADMTDRLYQVWLQAQVKQEGVSALQAMMGPVIVAKLPWGLLPLLAAMLSPNPALRPTMAAVLLALESIFPGHHHENHEDLLTTSADAAAGVLDTATMLVDGPFASTAASSVTVAAASVTVAASSTAAIAAASSTAASSVTAAIAASAGAECST